jgi:hypothetical protein
MSKAFSYPVSQVKPQNLKEDISQGAYLVLLLCKFKTELLNSTIFCVQLWKMHCSE